MDFSALVSLGPSVPAAADPAGGGIPACPTNPALGGDGLPVCPVNPAFANLLNEAINGVGGVNAEGLGSATAVAEKAAAVSDITTVVPAVDDSLGAKAVASLPIANPDAPKNAAVAEEIAAGGAEGKPAVSPNETVPLPLETTGTKPEAVPKDQVEGPKPKTAKVETEPPPESPPPGTPRNSRKEAKTKAPNALVQKLDRPARPRTETEGEVSADGLAETITEPTFDAAPVLASPVAEMTATPAASVVPIVTAPATNPATTDSTPAKTDTTTVTAVAAAPVAVTPKAPLSTKNVTVSNRSEIPATPDTEATTLDATPLTDQSANIVADLSASAVDAAPVNSNVANGGPVLPSAPDLDVVPTVVANSAAVTAPAVVATGSPTVDSPTADTPVVDTKPVSSKAKIEKLAAPVVEDKVASTTKKAEQPVAKIDGGATVIEISAKTSGSDTGDSGSNNPENAPKDNIAPAQSNQTAATERPEEGTDRPAIDRHLVVRQVADRIENLVAARPRDGVTIHLEPRDMGTVTLVVKGAASALDVQMFASDDRVREGLQNSRPDLAVALAPRGIELREVKVSASAGSSGMGTGQRDSGASNQDGQPRQQARQTSSPQSFIRSTDRSVAETRPRGLRRGRGVDLIA